MTKLIVLSALTLATWMVATKGMGSDIKETTKVRAKKAGEDSKKFVPDSQDRLLPFNSSRRGGNERLNSPLPRPDKLVMR